MQSSFRNGRYQPSTEPDWSGFLVARSSKRRFECPILERSRRIKSRAGVAYKTKLRRKKKARKAGRK